MLAQFGYYQPEIKCKIENIIRGVKNIGSVTEMEITKPKPVYVDIKKCS